MMKNILAATFILASTWASARELDRDMAASTPTLNKNVVLRVNNKTKEVAYLEVAGKVSNKSSAVQLAQNSDDQFQQVPNSKMKSELDQDGGTSSWYFYSPYYGGYYGSYYGYYPYYCYNNYYYSPYYYYSWGGYSYYYYGRGFGY